MRLMRHVPLLESTLKTVAFRPLLSSQCHRYRYSSTSAAYPERIAVLGGGIAGLASAYFVGKEFPNSKITIFESGKETGGWIKSRRVDVPGGDILFELGPRTLRNATPTASLIQELDLVKDITYTKRTEPGAKNRFIYFPDRLNRLPSESPSLVDLFTLWRSGILGGAFGAIKEPLIPTRPQDMTDETVGSFLARRVDKRVADNIVSAVFHGIYAGDIWQLSAKTLLSLAWQLEGRYGSALGGFFRMQSEDPRPQQLTIVHPYDLEVSKAINEEIDLDLEFTQNLKEASMFTFKDGLQHLVRALQKSVEGKGNVQVKTESPIQSFKPIEGEMGVEIISGNEPSTQKENFDLVISTLRNDELTPYITVMTVNLYYSNPALLPVEGFGYLIPQSIPFEENPERALGVIFDSSAIKGQDTAEGTKITVMMGGHWWDGWESYSSEEEGLEMAKSVIKRHIGITDEPVAHCANLSKSCIPQYTLGYEDRLRDFANGITNEFKGRLRVVGSQFNGVSVNDCITGAWNIARGLRGEGWKSRSCGLDRVVDSRAWTVVPVGDMAYKKKSVYQYKQGDGEV
ncbi:protoporphyrinogen oxidase [Cucurbitaria berberidis CBS 394.84]|uniref:Protoporphyrinogen oxidase n=1 Tax=Cucurbitaria berberidis CBS 394.84 TaxID=1168544 RepID=A0A9P4G7F8_9PLEO|nr:protoporphyrinogen oxidase [Cucurbitaria berberidis CBS 394.84]KAF1840327.1 protoporphyrinogen oxidase [Cucurbitaria berberidis CBS 394.84]